MLTILTGILYPLLITGVAKTVFPEKANGSLVFKNNRIVGSALIGQTFDSAIYFSSRPSASIYNALSSGGSNYALTNATLKKLVEERKKAFIFNNQIDSLSAIPSEMLFASGSGLDPHISVESALLQVNRIAKARNFNEKQKEELVEKVKANTEFPQWRCLGETRINVLLINLEIDKIK